MLLNVMYHNKKVGGDADYLDIIYKDLDTGEKFVETIREPEIEIYFTKEKYRNYDYNKLFIELDQTEMHRCKFNNLPFYIAQQAGDMFKKFIEDCKATGNWGKIHEIHKYPYVFGSDYDIENWVRIQWVLHNDNDRPKYITKQFLDIEVDSYKFDGFPKEGECPINAATIVDKESKSVFTFLLRNPENPLIADFEARVDEFIKELHDDFDDVYGVLDYNIYMYDDECDLIVDMFKLINTLKRDFMLIWNMGFDIPYIIERLKKLGLDPIRVMCHKDFKVKYLFYKKDYKTFSIPNKGDYFRISSYTTYLDQMINYGGLRKGQGEIRSFSLNAVAEKEIGDSKLDYSEAANIKTLAWVDYWLFVKYNIKDVLLQMGIEDKTGDTDNIYQRAYANATVYHKVFKQTVFLKNRAYVEFYKQGLIIGNNINVDYGESTKNKKAQESDEGDDDEKFDGALVADPMLNSHTGVKIFGKRSMFIYDNAVDMDFSSMYPNIIITFNVAPNTMIGKLIIDSSIGEVSRKIQNSDNSDIDDKGKEFVDNYLIGNYGLMGTKWFGLPGILELDKKVREQFGIKNRKKYKVPELYGNTHFIDKLVIEIGDDGNGQP